MGNIKLSKGDFSTKLAKQPQKHGAHHRNMEHPADSMAESKRVYKQMNMIILNLR